VRPLWSLLFLAIACGNPTDPQLLPGSYSLMSIDGTPLPLLRRATLDCDFTVTDATLRIGPADSASLNVSENYDCTRSGGQLTIGGRAYPGTFTVAARVLTLVSPTLGGPPVEIDRHHRWRWAHHRSRRPGRLRCGPRRSTTSAVNCTLTRAAQPNTRVKLAAEPPSLL
jgi:hypothetical protein